MVMKSFRHRLPPLNSLLVFEAAVRTGSFTAAARELHVSQAAVSKQIKALEERLGVPLFERQGRRVVPTGRGRQLQEKVNASLNYLADAVDDMSVREQTLTTVTLSANTAMSYFWLNRALAAYHRAHADHPINFRVVTSDHTPDLFAEEVDIAVAYDPGTRIGWTQRVLFDEELFPVASADYLQTHPLKGGDVADLLAHRLLDFERIEPNWINWKVWLQALGHGDNALRVERRFNNYAMLLEAAERGQGITLGTAHLLTGKLEQGALVRATDLTVLSGRSYFLGLNDKSAGRAECQDVYHWLLVFAGN